LDEEGRLGGGRGSDGWFVLKEGVEADTTFGHRREERRGGREGRVRKDRIGLVAV